MPWRLAKIREFRQFSGAGWTLIRIWVRKIKPRGFATGTPQSQFRNLKNDLVRFAPEVQDRGEASLARGFVDLFIRIPGSFSSVVSTKNTYEQNGYIDPERVKRLVHEVAFAVIT